MTELSIKNNKKLKVLLFILTLLLIFTGCEQAEEKEETAETKYDNGAFIAYSDATEHGYAWAKINLEDDDITEVKLMEVTSSGDHKDYDTYDYEESVEAYEEMPGRFEEADSADVDIYSGATDSSEKYIQAVDRALKIAAGETEGDYFDGTFQGSSEEPSDYGFGIALVTFEDDNITEVELKEVDEEGEERDYSNEKYEDAVEANEIMAERFEENNSADVDTYTGATISSEKYIEAVEDALLHAGTARNNDEKEEDIKE